MRVLRYKPCDISGGRFTVEAGIIKNKIAEIFRRTFMLPA